jgi:hypothetical protein
VSIRRLRGNCRGRPKHSNGTDGEMSHAVTILTTKRSEIELKNIFPKPAMCRNWHGRVRHGVHGAEGLGMAGLGEILWSPWPPLAIQISSFNMMRIKVLTKF